MHPESEIAAEFWAHVNHRGHGEKGEGEEWLPRPQPLMAELERQYWLIHEFKGEDADELKAFLVPNPEGGKPEPWFGYAVRSSGYHLPPTGFPTLQAALYDYLLAQVGSTLIGNSYAVWVQAVVHILADAARDPSRLTIPVSKRTGDNRVYDFYKTEPHTMAIADDWDVLRRETFDFACRNYESAWSSFSKQFPDV